MINKASLRLLMSTTCLSLALCSGVAAAQQGQRAPQPDAVSATTLDEVVVTARRTSENLQRVPVAATVLTGEVLDRQGIRRATDLQYSTPSLVIAPDALGGTSAPIFQLRGQTSPLGADNTVVNYFADVPVDSRVIAAGIYDLASVQVLRGPQGTLFGKNSTGGAVLFTPRKAQANSLNGYVNAAVGSYDLKQLTGAINLPLIQDVLAVRLSGQVARQDGFVNNLSGPDGNDKHYDAARASIVFTPNDRFSNEFLGTYFNGEQHLNPPIVQAIGGVANFFPAVIAAFSRQKLLGQRTVDQSFTPNNDNNRSYLLANTTAYDFGGATLKNIIGYSNTHNFVRQNATSFNFPLVDVAQDRHQDQFSDELQLSGTSFNDSLKWIVGGFYSKQKTTVDQTIIIFSTVPTGVDASRDSYTSKAVYGQATYDLSGLGLQGVKLTGGVRQTWDDRTGSSLISPIPLNMSDNPVSWTVGLDYQITPDVLLYAASRHSYKAGGFNLIAPDVPAALKSYASEELTDVELGVKASFQVGAVPIRANLAAYQGDYKNIHTQSTALCTSVTGLSSLIINAGSGTPKGVEVELEARPLEGLRVSGYYNRTLGTYDEFTVPVVPGCTLSAVNNSLNGQNFGNISKDTFGLTAVYKLPIPDRYGDLSVTGDMYQRSARLGNDLRGFQSPMPGYSIYNVRIDYANIGGTGVSVAAYGRNLGDELYGLTRNNTLNTAGYDTTTFGDPRTYGFEVNLAF